MSEYKTPDHVAYADETQHNLGRHRGLSLITLSVENAIQVNQDLQQILQQSSVREFKWSNLRSARERFAALKIIEYIVQQAYESVLRVDVLTWDIEDSRHKVAGRSDTRNLRRMYYFLFKNVLCKRWNQSFIWRICPDENSSEPWSHLGYLNEIFDWNTHELIAEINIAEIIACQSHESPLIQVADLLAGLAVYSRSSYTKFEEWSRQTSNENRNEVKSNGKPMQQLSRADHERCLILAQFNEQCKKYKMGVSLETMQGLRTFNPVKPMNFWWYEPQTEKDIAPIW